MTAHVQLNILLLLFILLLLLLLLLSIFSLDSTKPSVRYAMSPFSGCKAPGT